MISLKRGIMEVRNVGNFSDNLSAFQYLINLRISKHCKKTKIDGFLEFWQQQTTNLVY